MRNLMTQSTSDFTAAQVAKARDLIAADGLVPTNRQGVFRAVSSDGQRAYLVTADGICECPAAAKYGRPCAHHCAVLMALELLDETSDAARCEDCAHLPGECDCPHFCNARGI